MGLSTEAVYAILKKKIEDSGGQVDPEQIQTAVDNYLSENPVESGELAVEDHVVVIEGVNG